MTEIETTIWNFVRKDLSPAEFEQWVYAHPELENYWGAEFYLDVISSGFVQERHLYELRESLRYWTLAHTPPPCDCVTWESPADLRKMLWEGIVEWESVVETEAYLSAHFNALKRRDERHQLIVCRKCGQNWYLGVDEIEVNYHLLRLSEDQVKGIYNEDRWPTNFDTLNSDFEEYYSPVKAKPKPYKSTLQRLRVPLGFVTAILFVIASRPSWRSLLIGAPVALCGAGIRAWASGHLRKNAELAVSGPYAYTRNPLYLGSFVMALGCATAGGTWWLGVLLLAFFLLIYVPVMQAEAAHMHELFPQSFAEYERQVPLFLPRLTPYRLGEPRGFDASLYLRYREYRALIGLSVVIAILVAKVMLAA